MPQFRLTKKFATDLKLTALSEPHRVVSIFDDWVFDTIPVSRKKLAIVTHVETKLTFLFPYASIGGANNVPKHLKNSIKNYLLNNEFVHFCEEIEKLFSEKIIFTKTSNRSVISNMNDFKNHISGYTETENFDQINWEKVADRVNDIIINAQNLTERYVTPTSVMQSILYQFYINFISLAPKVHKC